MSTTILILAGITVLLIMFALAQIVSRLPQITSRLQQNHLDLLSRYYMVRNELRLINEKLDGDGNTGAQPEKKPEKQRIYWRDQNGFKHWRKNA